MAQLSLYLDDSEMEQLREEASARKLSLSSYVRGVLAERRLSSWPDGFFELYGSIDDETFVAPPELPFDERVPVFD